MKFSLAIILVIASTVVEASKDHPLRKLKKTGVEKKSKKSSEKGAKKSKKGGDDDDDGDVLYEKSSKKCKDLGGEMSGGDTMFTSQCSFSCHDMTLIWRDDSYWVVLPGPDDTCFISCEEYGLYLKSDAMDNWCGAETVCYSYTDFDPPVPPEGTEKYTDLPGGVSYTCM